ALGLDENREVSPDAIASPIQWERVHQLPDFVYFSHKRHVLGGVECEECHGNVGEDFTVARRVNTLEMGWCLECHKDHPKVEENYGAQAELRRSELKDCITCHK
ncbi:MAG: cytochrome c3 family protein, partial [Myxococcota bacterium]|nr:cytochrome c3 family protein [Myxococcota bacterium]